MGEAIFSTLKTGEFKSCLWYLNKYFQKLYTARKTAVVKLCVGHWSECSMRLVVSNTSKLFGRFQIRGNRVVNIGMICKIYDMLGVTDS